MTPSQEMARISLDWRLLDLCTGSAILEVAEYIEWQRTGYLSHIRSVLSVQDAAAAAWQEHARNESENDYLNWLRNLDLPLPKWTSETSETEETR